MSKNTYFPEYFDLFYTRIEVLTEAKRNHCYRRGDGLSGRRYDLTSGILPSGKSHAEEKTERLKAPDQQFINRHDTDERSRGND